MISIAVLIWEQFNVSNTLPDTVLEQVSVIMQPQTESGLTEDFILTVPTLSATTSPSIIYVSFSRDSPEEYVTASFQCVLKFISKELDPSTGEPEEEGYEDEYQLEEVELTVGGDYIIPSYSSFSSEWDRLRSGAIATETFFLAAMESIQGTSSHVPSALFAAIDDPNHGIRGFSLSPTFTAACDSIIEILNMEPLGGTETASSTSVHTLQLSGLITGGGGKVLVRCRMTFSKGQGVTLELGVRAEQERACALIVSAISG